MTSRRRSKPRRQGRTAAKDAGKEEAKKENHRARESASGRRRRREEGRQAPARRGEEARPPDPALDVLATVDGAPILRREFNEYLEQVPGRFAELVTTPEGRLSIIERLVNKRVILEARPRRRVHVDAGFLDAYRPPRRRSSRRTS
jgi:hypothetical protein